MSKEPTPVPIEARIYVVRGQKVMLDSDLAAIYGAPTFVFNQAVRRNRDRFPDDFMFQLAREEFASLTSQTVMSKPSGRGGRRTLPNVFTEHGALMAASLLNSPRAVEMSIHVVRAFVRLRQMIQANQELAARFSELERKVSEHDEGLRVLVMAVQELINPPEPERPRIGFSHSDKDLQG